MNRLKWVCALLGGKCTTSGVFCGVATAPHKGRCDSDECVAEEDVTQCGYCVLALDWRARLHGQHGN
jgi:hypothetical protein